MGLLCSLSEFIAWRVKTRPAALGQFLFQLDSASESRRVGSAQNATDQACLQLDPKLPEKGGTMVLIPRAFLDNKS